MEHYVICDSSYSCYSKCTHKECPYHLKHFEPQPEDWIVAHRINITTMGGKCLMIEVGNNG